jgi:hypothetical protein
MIKKNIDIILLIVILLFNNLKYINLENNYNLLLIILFIEYINNNKLIETFTESSIKNTAILHNIFSIFNKEQVSLKNVIIDGDVKVSGTKTDAKDLVILSDKGLILNGWKFEKKGANNLLIYNEDIDLDKQSIYGTGLYSKYRNLYIKPDNSKYFYNCCSDDKPYGTSCSWRANQNRHMYDYTGSCSAYGNGIWKNWIDLYGEIDNNKEFAKTKFSSVNDSYSGHLKIRGDVSAGQFRGHELEFKSKFRATGRGTTYFYSKGIEQYKNNGELNWARWPPSPPPPPATVASTASAVVSTVGGWFGL